MFSKNLEVTEAFLKLRVEKMCGQKKMSVGEGFFYVSCVFNVIAYL